MDSSSNNPLDSVQSLQDVAGKNYVTLKQAANIIGKSYQVLLKYVEPDPEVPGSKPKLNAVRVGGRWRVYEEELRRFLLEGNQK